ncbi:MAG: hypothetical protein L0Z07_06115, partial [Planctomycetes bacterium]|nr:hypothetical protein [Planctomycetota bacterium]
MDEINRLLSEPPTHDGQSAPGAMQSLPAQDTDQVVKPWAALLVSRRLLLLFTILLAILIGPHVVGQFVYHATFSELRAGADVATSALESLKPRLNDLELASRLIAKR